MQADRRAWVRSGRSESAGKNRRNAFWPNYWLALPHCNCPVHELPDFRVAERRHLLVEISWPVWRVRVEVSDSGGDIRIAASETLDQFCPAPAQRLSWLTRRIFVERCFHV